jgi:4a-hydroxytetrahydrobiopterin dehydratase
MWKEESDSLVRAFEFKDFKQAFTFMTAVSFEAEEMGHHPDWSNVYNRVEIRLNTHDAGGVVTDQDHQLSQRIDVIWDRMSR